MGNVNGYLGEIRIFSFNYRPQGWAFCNGQLLPINQNVALYSLLGTRYGGNGLTNFALPDLRGRIPVHVGEGLGLGSAGGAETHTLSAAELPAHTHVAQATSDAATAAAPAGNLLAAVDQTTFGPVYQRASQPQALADVAVSTVGSGQPHSNMQPYLVLNFCICLVGTSPAPS